MSDAKQQLGLNRVFDPITLSKAQQIVNSRNDDQAKANRLFYNGDHWQNSEGWVGPRASNPEGNTGELTLKAIEKAFVSRNVVAEVTGRHVNGVLGRQLHWKFTVKRELDMVEVTDPDTGQRSTQKAQPTDEEQALIDEAEAVLVDWWDKRGITEILQNMLASALTTKRGVLRLYVPAGLRDEQGNLPAGELQTTMQYVWVQHLGTNEETLDLQFPSATVYTDKNSRREIGVFAYREAKEFASEILQDGAVEEDRAELTYLAEDGNTVLRVINQASDVEDPLVLPLGGRLTIYEMTRRWLITPQVVSQQKGVNLVETMEKRNIVFAGFLERIFSNVDWPGKWVGEGDNKKFIPEPVNVGPGFQTNIRGIEVENDDGKRTLATPGVNYREPVTSETFIAAEENGYLVILQETHQLHYANSGDNVISGESRKQARDSFTLDLEFSGGKVQGTARWLLETSLAIAAYFAGRAGQFEVLRADVEAHIDAGPIGPDEMRVAADMRDKGLWSTERAQSYTGVEDVDAENRRIERERQEQSKRDAENQARMQKLIDTINPPPDPTVPGGNQKQPAAADS